MDTKGTEDEDVDSIARELFTNLLLLGMDVEDMEAVYKVPFNKDMFNQYNKTGSEAVMHFLFYNLNPTLCDEQFRDCWPVSDKKTEMHFRKTCFNWLVTIKQTEHDEHWPNLNASSLQFPGRSKFIHILYCFSTHVLIQNMKPELEHQHFLVCPSLELHSNEKVEIISSITQDNISVQLKQYRNQMYITNSAHHMWKTYAGDLVKDCRSISKNLRDVEEEKRSTVGLLAESALKQGCALPVKRTLSMFDGDKEDTDLRRLQRLQRVKASWEKVTLFSNELEQGREIVKSVLENSSSRKKLEATDIGIRIPGLLLKQCEKEIRQQQIDNIYIGGRLNLLSVLQLWNLCLRLYMEQLEAENLPDLSTESQGLAMQAHKLHSFLMEIQALRKEMSTVFIPDLERSFQQHRKEVKFQIEDVLNSSKDQSMLGLRLMTPVQPKSMATMLQPGGDTPVTAPVTSRKLRTGTPDVVSEMISSIVNASQRTQTKQPSQLAHAFEHVKLNENSSSSLKKAQRSQSSLNTSNSKSTKSIPVRKFHERESRSRHLQSQHGRLNRGHESKLVTKENLNASGKEPVSKPKPAAENVLLSSSYKEAFDLLAHSLGDSVLIGNEQNKSKSSNVSFSHSSKDIDETNAPSFSQGLMLELEQTLLASKDYVHKSSSSMVDSGSSSKFDVNGARPKKKSEEKSSIWSRKDCMMNSDDNIQPRTSSDDGKDLSPRTITNTSTRLVGDFSPDATANGSSASFLDQFCNEMSQTVSPFRDKNLKGNDQGKYENSSAINQMVSNPGVTTDGDSFISPSENLKSKGVRQSDFLDLSRNLSEMMEKIQLENVWEKGANERGLGDGQANEQVQSTVQATYKVRGDSNSDNSDDWHRRSSSSDSEDDMITSARYSLIDSQKQLLDSNSNSKMHNNSVTPKYLSMPGSRNNPDHRSTIDQLSRNEDDDSLLYDSTDASGLVDHFHADDYGREDKAEGNIDYSFSTLKQGILFNGQSPIKNGPFSTLKEESNNNSPEVQNVGISPSPYSSRSKTVNDTTGLGSILTEVDNLFAMRSRIFEDIDD